MSRRQQRLFAAACCRRAWHLLTDERSREAVRAAEDFADGIIRLGLLSAAAGVAAAAVLPGRWDWRTSSAHDARSYVAAAVRDVAALHVAPASVASYIRCALAYSLGRHPGPDDPERAAQVALLRDICGNPFRPVVADPGWLRWNDGAVRRLAEGIYEGRRFADLPILADALEEAGCADAALLDHLRGPGPHVLGCWALDALLGRD